LASCVEKTSRRRRRWPNGQHACAPCVRRVSPVFWRRMPTVRLMILPVFVAGTMYAQSAAEEKLEDAIKSPQTTIVHLWAPWCSNCQAELKTGGWTKMINENPQVNFYFDSDWNNGQYGRTMLNKFGSAAQQN